MAEQTNDIEQQVEALIRAGFAHSDGNAHDTTTQDETEKRNVIDVDLYHLEGGAVLLVPNNGTNPLETNAIDSQAPTTQEQEAPATGTPRPPLEEVQPQEAAAVPQDVQPEPAVPVNTKRRVEPYFVLVPLFLLCLLTAGAVSYWYLLPLTATATVTITPKMKSLTTTRTFTIAQHPATGQIQGRPLEAISLTRSETVPATGHAHDDATAATGILTFYNADASAYTIPAGTSFIVQGVTVVTDTTVTVQAAIPPSFGIGITQAHTIQAGSAGNIPTHTIDTRCCGSQFVTATNTTTFTGGQDARSYSFIQSSDIQNAVNDLLQRLTPQATAGLQKEMKPGEQLVTPVCTPRTQESAEPGSEGASVTVSVTQTCTSVAYQLASLQQTATSTLAQNASLANYQEEGSLQVTVNGSTYTNRTALLHVSLSGVWLYHFTKAQLQQLTHQLAGENQEHAKTLLATTEGIAHANIQLQRLDFKNQLPTDPQHISIQFFSLIP